jgi:hypothetical protein
LTWRAKFSVGGPIGFAFVGLILVLDVWLLDQLLNEHIQVEQISLLTFVLAVAVLLSVPAVLFLAYQALSCLTLRYHLDRNGVVVRWAGTELAVPIRDIQRVLPGQNLGDTVLRRRGLRWPGHERGDGMVPGVGRTRFLATKPVRGQVFLLTPGQAYAISPRDPSAFLKAFEVRRELGPNRLLESGAQHVHWLSWRIWTDQTAWVLIGAATIINIGLFGYLCARFPGLDLQLPLHFNTLGMVDRIGNKMELFALPIIGLIVLGGNFVLGLGLYLRERAGSYLLWGAAAAVQSLFWLAAFSIVP